MLHQGFLPYSSNIFDFVVYYQDYFSYPCTIALHKCRAEVTKKERIKYVTVCVIRFWGQCNTGTRSYNSGIRLEQCFWCELYYYNIIGSKGVLRLKEVSISSVLSWDVQLNYGRYVHVYAYTCLSLSRFIAHALNIPTTWWEYVTSTCTIKRVQVLVWTW